MPIYELACKYCGSKIEQIRQMDDFSDIFCPCGEIMSVVPSRSSFRIDMSPLCNVPDYQEVQMHGRERG